MRKVDPGIIAGLSLTGCALVAGLLLEGGRLTQVMQPTAALIVLGGTMGAVLVHYPFAIARAAVTALGGIFFVQESGQAARSNLLVRLATDARRSGITSLEPQLRFIGDSFFIKALMLAIDGFTAGEVREIMELEQMRLDEEDEGLARVWETAGGFAPTLGILGAVLGLIQVMQHLDEIASVGHGIAVAFVATLYGVGFANLVFLPLAGKLRLRARERQVLREMTVEGVVAIVEGASTRALRERLGLKLAESAKLVAK